MVWSDSSQQFVFTILIMTVFAEILQKGKEGKEARGKPTYHFKMKLMSKCIHIMSVSSKNELMAIFINVGDSNFLRCKLKNKILSHVDLLQKRKW